jgi:hypothetical protein
MDAAFQTYAQVAVKLLAGGDSPITRSGNRFGVTHRHSANAGWNADGMDLSFRPYAFNHKAHRRNLDRIGRANGNFH